MSKRLEILEGSLNKKQQLFNDKIAAHFADVKSANGQPLNDKRNGQATLNRWERQNDSLRNLKQGIEVTKQAIEAEKGKIFDVESAKAILPAAILELVDSGELVQWRKHPTTFFVKGVDRARIIYDKKSKLIAHRYTSQVTDKEQWAKFAKTFNSILNSLKNLPLN